MASRWPRTIKTGRFAGRTFASQSEYDAARKSTPPPAGDIGPSRTNAPAAPRVQYTKGMVEAVIKMIEGALSFTPLFRGENGITEEEHNWLVADWFDFGKRHPFFAKLITQMFAVDLYGQLALDHVIIVGSRLIATNRLPEQARFPILGAYMMRQAMAGEVSINVESESPDLGVETGGTPSPSGGDRDGQDLFSPALADTPAA